MSIFGRLDGQCLEVRQREVRLNLNLKGISQRSVLGNLDVFRIIKLRLAEHGQAVFLDRLLVALLNQEAANLLFDVVGKSFFQELSRRMADAKAGNVRVAAEFLELLFELFGNAIARDFHRDFLCRRP